MSDTSPLLQSVFQNTQSVVVVYPRQAMPETLAIAAAVTLTLQAAGKEVSLISPQLPNPTTSLVGLEQTRTELGHQNLLVSFEYSEDKVDKISYHIGEETGKFYLTIKPKKGQPPLDPKSVEFSYAGLETDLIVLVGVESLESLDQLYIGYEEVYEKTPSITIATTNAGLGGTQINQNSCSCLSEAVAQELRSAGLVVTPDAATNLLTGIDEATEGLTAVGVGAETFQTIADLIRVGGVRVPRDKKNGKKHGGVGSVELKSSSSVAPVVASPTLPKKPQETEMKVEVRRAK